VTDNADLKVEVEGPNLIVSGGGFCAVYCKSTDQPQLLLRTETDDYELLTRAWIIANRRPASWDGLCERQASAGPNEASPSALRSYCDCWRTSLHHACPIAARTLSQTLQRGDQNIALFALGFPSILALNGQSSALYRLGTLFVTKRWSDG
jgi:hypothetical protein